MSVCTFFGHRDTSWKIEEELCRLLEKLIVCENVDLFYIGTQGNFDKIAVSAVKKMQAEFPHIKYYIVYAYLPTKGEAIEEKSLYPEGLENVPKRFAINSSNKWLDDNSEYVVTCVTRSFGGAAKFKQYAERKNKRVIDLNALTLKGGLMYHDF